MLVLTRKKTQSFKIGENIEVTILSIDGEKVRIGIDAPENILILRKELYDETIEENKKASQSPTELIDRIEDILK